MYYELSGTRTGPEVYKHVFMLNSAETKIYPTHTF